MNLISVFPYLYEYLSQTVKAVPVNTPAAVIKHPSSGGNWSLNWLFCGDGKLVILDLIEQKIYLKEKKKIATFTRLFFFWSEQAIFKGATRSDVKDLAVKLVFASNPASNKTVKRCFFQRSSSLSDSPANTRRLKMNPGPEDGSP